MKKIEPYIKNLISSLMMVLVFGISSFSKAQGKLDRVYRFDNKNVTTIFNNKPLKFSNEGGHDTDYVNIMVDSLSLIDKKYRLFVYYSDSIKALTTVIKVGFNNGKVKEFNPSKIVVSEKYVEYELNEDDVYTFLINRYDSFGFFSKKRMAVCTSSIKSDYFMEFIRATMH